MGLGDFLFRGDGEIDQLSKIFSLLGSANEESWPGVSQLQNYMEFTQEVEDGGI